MLQESAAWDPMVSEPATTFTIYVLFLIVACCVTIVRLMRIWRAAPPFRLSSQAKNPKYLKLLQISKHSLSYWIGCTFLGWAILGATVLYDVCRGLLDQKATGLAVFQFVIRDISMALGMALWVVVFIFLVRWHVSDRIERLRD